MKSIFLCVQPIRIENETIQQIINVEDFSMPEETKLPEWISHIKKLNDISYENLKSIKLPNVDSKLLHKHLPESIASLLNMEDTKHYLLFDTELMYFNLCLEVHIDYSTLSLDAFNELVDNHDEETNLYCGIRGSIVKENEDSLISEWTELIYVDTLRAIENFFLENHIENPQINIPICSGNITNFLYLSKTYLSFFTDKFVKLNKVTDRFYFEDRDPLVINEIERYYFGGRFHTIIVSNERDITRYFPIQFQMQFNWFYTAMVTKFYNYLNKSVLKKLGTREKLKIMKWLIDKILLFELNNELFKQAIESNKNAIYDKIESNWNVEQSIHTLSEYVKKFEQYIQEENNHLIEFEKASSQKKEKTLLKQIDSLTEERRMLEESGHKDELTRAYNRKKFYVDVEQYQQEKSFYLSFIDGDKFKNINDTYGHQAGDEVLKMMVNVMFVVLNENEVEGGVYRYGGEEFLLAIVNEKDLSVLGILNKIKDEIENTVIEYNDQKIKFTISIGAAKNQENTTIENLIEISDQLVYKAKENGRNRIEYIF